MSVDLGHPTRTYDPVSISPLSFWADTAADREKSFKILRDERPISWHRPIDGALMAPEIDGVWAVTRHEDISLALYVFTASRRLARSLIDAIPSGAPW